MYLPGGYADLRFFSPLRFSSRFTITGLVLEQNLDSMEDIEVLEVGLDEVKELIKNGEINHALVVSAFYFLNEFKQNNGS